MRTESRAHIYIYRSARSESTYRTLLLTMCEGENFWGTRVSLSVRRKVRHVRYIYEEIQEKF